MRPISPVLTLLAVACAPPIPALAPHPSVGYPGEDLVRAELAGCTMITAGDEDSHFQAFDEEGRLVHEVYEDEGVTTEASWTWQDGCPVQHTSEVVRATAAASVVEETECDDHGLPISTVRVDQDGLAVSFAWDLAYDDDGRLVSRTSEADGIVTTYRWDGADLVDVASTDGTRWTLDRVDGWLVAAHLAGDGDGEVRTDYGWDDAGRWRSTETLRIDDAGETELGCEGWEYDGRGRVTAQTRSWPAAEPERAVVQVDCG